MTIVQHDTSIAENPHLLFFSSNTDLDKKILSNNPFVTWHIILPLNSIAGSYLSTLLLSIFSFIKSFFYLYKHKPKKIITTGGVIAIPVCIAGFLLRIPIILYSLDAKPGKAIKALIPFADSIITCFASTQHFFPARKCSFGPYPIKFNINDTTLNTHDAKKNLGLSPNKKTIVILGGSQGSLFLNNCIKQFLTNASFPIDTLQIIHQTGSLDTTDWPKFYASHNITAHVFSYHPDLSTIYTAADLIICRAGAGTLFEIKFFNKRCIIIPLKTSTTNHQVNNAQAMVDEYPEFFYTIAQDIIEKDSKVLFAQIKEFI